MILPENMVKVEIISPIKEKDNVVKEILKLGKMEPVEPSHPISNERIEEARRELTPIQDHVNKIRLIIEIAGATIEPSGAMKVDSAWVDLAKKTAEEASLQEFRYKELLEEIGKLKGEIDVIKAQLTEIEPFSSITVNLSRLYSLERLEVVLTLLTKEQMSKVRERKDVFVETRETSNGKYATLLVTLKGKVQLEALLKEIGARKFETQDGKSPFEVYSSMKERLSELEKILGETRENLMRKIKENQRELNNLYGRLLTVRDALSLLSKARVSDHFVQIEGYMPEKFLGRLKKSLEKFAFVYSVTPKRFGEAEEPPTYVDLPKSIAAIESVVEIYGTPSYWEISPLVFLIVTFPLLFGLMFPDVGNALVLLVFAVFFHRYGVKKGSTNIKNLSLILGYSSVVAMVTGFLARDFFGPLPVGGLKEMGIANVSGPLDSVWPVPVSVTEALSPLLPFGEYSTSTSIEHTIILSILLGAIALFVSSLLGVINAIKKRDSEFLLFEKLPLLVIYTVPLIIFGYGVTDPSHYFGKVGELLGYILQNLLSSFHPDLSTPTSALAYVLIVWVEIGLIYNWLAKAYILRKHEHMATGSALAMGFIEGGFEAAILLLSNTISFIRILVFALAHYYLLYAFSYMAYLAVGTPSLLSIATSPAAIVILIIGNLLAIGLEGLVVFIQDMRLHFYEMFSKFYEGRGKKFEPLMASVEIS
ncbi:V-type ATP synthase subunit I [Metallosphaera tengchongensis]|uniref:A-type ATP synthase subunit I n=1 Tax=Metallosphaera tengchongensis TaxID=1532350 RepID=A0A6N0NWJ0_9CREN|nr:V-type ATP synthase subunit I [Metallosphaera tengchongensis]QKQ99509.1 V-type ATP synthase subunit I [Metallosphaera tengchongensis]